jgi:hypothetical protein
MPKPKRCELTGKQCRGVEDLLPGKPARSAADNLNVVNGVP